MCKAEGCAQQHSSHYCRHCKDRDSDHRSINCSKISTTHRRTDKENASIIKCKVQECDQQHSSHYCRVCKSSDSDHRAKNCPKGITVYHGTSAENAELITKNGFKVSETGRLGRGAYFAEKYQVARDIAVKRLVNKKKQCVVIKCHIYKYEQTEVQTEVEIIGGVETVTAVETNTSSNTNRAERRKQAWARAALVTSPFLLLGPIGWISWGLANTITGIGTLVVCAVEKDDTPTESGNNTTRSKSTTREKNYANQGIHPVWNGITNGSFKEFVVRQKDVGSIRIFETMNVS